MKKVALLLALLVWAISMPAQTKLWERSSAAGNFPSFLGTGSLERGFATSTITLNPIAKTFEKSSAASAFPTYLGTGSLERGMAYGKSGANDRIYLVSRTGGSKILVLNAATGDSVSRLDTTGFAAIASGTYLLNDVETSSDGAIFVCNLTTNATTSAFKVYKWSSESATPVLAVSYTGLGIRLGDKFTVTGSTADNSVTIWAAGAGTKSVVKFTTTDNGATFTPTVITLVGGSTLAATPAVYPNTTGSEFYVKSNSVYIMRYLANGTVVDSVSGSLVGLGANALRYFELGAKKFLACYVYGTGNENATILDVTNGLASATVVGKTSSLGTTSNANGTGDVAFKPNGDNTVTLYVLGTNNGLGAYKIDPANSGTFERMYLVSRTGGSKILVLNAATGDSVSRLDTTGFAAIASGTYLLNDVEASTDGAIFVCNLTTGSNTSPFKVYKWSNESATPVLAVNYTGPAIRLGDKFTVTGSTADNSIVIWAAGASSKTVVKFTTTDNGATFTPTVITLVGGSTLAATPAVYPNTTGSEFYVKSNSVYIMRYLANGTVVDSVSGSLVGLGANALRYFELGAKKFLACYVYGTGNENATILDVTNGLASATVVGKTSSLGTTSNANGTGDVSVKANGDGSENIYVLGTNNGIGAYKFTPPQKIATPIFTPAAGTYNAPFWVKLTVNTPGAKIYYTTNGATPDSTVSSTLFVDSLKVTADSIMIKAIAYAPGMITSDVATAVYKIVKIVVPPSDPLYPYWLKTQAAGTFPASFSTGNYERGMAYGKVAGKDRIYVVARTGGPKILVFDAMKGDSVGVMMPPASVTGGTFPLNFVGVSNDGVIFAGNMTIDVSTSSFKLYRWNSESDSAKTVIDTTFASIAGGRVGDIITVTGKASDNTLQVFAAVSGANKVIRFSTTTLGAKFTAEVITLANGNLGSIPSVAPASDSTLFIKSYGRAMYRYSAAGAVLDSISTGVVGTDVTATRYFERLGKKYVMCYSPNDGGVLTDERISIVDVTTPASAKVAYTSPSIGKTLNGNGTGAVDILPLANDNFLAFIMGTNNGLAAFSNSASLVINTLDTLFYGNTPTLLKNPYGSGFIAGTNGYGDIGKYERFPLKKNDVLSGFKCWFAYKKIVGDPDTVTLVVKTVATSGRPDSTIASVTIMADKIDTTNAGMVVILDNPVKVNGPVFIGFEFTPTANDTIAMYLDKDGEGDGANRVWEKYIDNTYGDFTTTQPNWGLNTDLWIAAYYKKAISTSVGKEEIMPQGYELGQNYPNPFNPSTTIRFSLSVKAKVTLTVFNLLGQRVAELANGDMQPGSHAVAFNASHLASGVYFYRLDAKGADGSRFVSTRKLMLLK